MIKHYTLTALRNAWRNKVSTLINVVGLAIGVACLAVVDGYISILENGDRHFKNASRTYFISATISTTSVKGTFTNTGRPLGAHIRTDFPDIEAVSRLY